ncbi:hypothetical protein GCM10010220_30690 [Streptomyces parvulus]|nr:hypothetical protein GCM10010220_30690 [Streptomyces parvulus]
MGVGAVSVMGRPIVRWDGRGRAGVVPWGVRGCALGPSPGRKGRGVGGGQALSAEMIRVP